MYLMYLSILCLWFTYGHRRQQMERVRDHERRRIETLYNSQNGWMLEVLNWQCFSQITIPSFWCDCACEHTIFVAFTFYTATANVRYSAYSRYRVILSSITSNKLNFTRLVYYSFSPRPLRCDCEVVSGYSLFSSVNSVYVPQYLTTRHYITVVISGFARLEDDLVV